MVRKGVRCTPKTKKHFDVFLGLRKLNFIALDPIQFLSTSILETSNEVIWKDGRQCFRDGTPQPIDSKIGRATLKAVVSGIAYPGDLWFNTHRIPIASSPSYYLVDVRVATTVPDNEPSGTSEELTLQQVIISRKGFAKKGVSCRNSSMA